MSKSYFTELEKKKRITEFLKDTEENKRFLEKARDRINKGPHQCHIIKAGKEIALSYKNGYYYHHKNTNKLEWIQTGEEE